MSYRLFAAGLSIVACVFATGALASTWKVEFAIDTELDQNPVTGFFEFDSIEDGVRGAKDVVFTSNKFRETGRGYSFENWWGGGFNTFDFEAGGVVGMKVGAIRRTEQGLHAIALSSGTLRTYPGDITFDFLCRQERPGGPYCGASNFGFVHGLELDLSAPELVPLPASLPLLIGGLAGLGWLARRRRTAATA